MTKKPYHKVLFLLVILLALIHAPFFVTAVQFPLQKEPITSSPMEVEGSQYTDSIWVTQIPFDNTVLQLTLMFYTNQTWISSVDQYNIKSFKCSDVPGCHSTNYTTAQEMLNYNVSGNLTYLDGTQFILADTLDYTPPASISGAIGLGSYNRTDGKSYIWTYPNIEPIVSIYLSRNFIQSSLIEFGGYESQYVLWNAQFQRITSADPTYWAFSLTKVDTQSLQGYAVFDLNMPFIGIPSVQYSAFVNNFTAQYGLNCSISGLSPVCDCGAFKTLPTLSFNLDDKTFELPPSSYTNTDTDSSSCNLLFTSLSSDNTTYFNVTDDFEGVWVLGEPFMTYYYMVFYYEDKAVEIAPSREISTSTAAWIIMILVTSFGFIGVVLYRCYQLGPKRKQKRREKREREKGLKEGLALDEVNEDEEDDRANNDDDVLKVNQDISEKVL